MDNCCFRANPVKTFVQLQQLWWDHSEGGAQGAGLFLQRQIFVVKVFIYKWRCLKNKPADSPSRTAWTELYVTILQSQTDLKKSMVWKHRAINNVHFASQPNNKPRETMCTVNSAVFIDHVYIHIVFQLRSIFNLRLAPHFTCNCIFGKTKNLYLIMSSTYYCNIQQ